MDSPAHTPETRGVQSKNSKSKSIASRLTASRISILSVILLVMIGLVSGLAGGWLEANQHADDQPSLTSSRTVVTNESRLISNVAKQLGPSVVSVNVTSQAAPSASDSFYAIGGGDSTQQSAGTGIIIASNGLIVTNRHVVPAGTTSVSVTLSDGTELDKVQVVGRTSANDTLDVAFLKITDTQGHKLTPAVIGDSSKVQVGDAVVAIGNALGQFQNTVTSGIISGHGRSVQAGDSGSPDDSQDETLADLFQTDAAINEGNSGGPLVNMSGQVIGLNTAIASNAQSIGFAIPVNDISGLIKNVIATGKFERPYLGVQYVSLTADSANQYSLKVNHGAYIVPDNQSSGQSVISGSPADKAGLKEGDIITQVSGTDVDQNHSLTALLGKSAVGDTVDLTVQRGAKVLHIKVTLAAAPSNPQQ